MIKNVKIKKIDRFSDNRGYFSEVVKEGDDIFCEIKQTSFTKTYPDVIKAFHWHKKQTDIWFPVSGNIQIVLYDLRVDSPTYKTTDVIYAGDDNPLVVLIPPHVAHGYKVLGSTPITLLYHTDVAYNPIEPDEQRLEWDDPMINFDWNVKNR